MPQSMEGNHGQLVCLGLAGVVVGENILQGAVWGVVAHHSAVVLGEYPVVTLPIGPHLQAVTGLLQLPLLKLLGNAAGNGNQAVAVPGLGNLHDLLPAYHGGGLCDRHGIVFKVHVIPGYSDAMNIVLGSPNFDNALQEASNFMEIVPTARAMQEKFAAKKAEIYSQPEPEGEYPKLTTMRELAHANQIQCDIARLNLIDHLTFLVSELERIALERKA